MDSASYSARRRERIDARGTAGRQITGQQPHAEHEDGDRRVRRGIGWRDAEQRRLEETRQGERDAEANGLFVTRFVPVTGLLVGFPMLTTLFSVGLAGLMSQAAVRVEMAPADVSVRQLTYPRLDGTRNGATLVRPAAANRAPHPAILFLHWYEPPRPTSNRTEFLAEAVELAASGVVSVLVDTPWSKEQWFPTRNAAKDYEFTVQEANEVRHALDVLLAQPGVDKTRVAVVGHDFGAMWGALAAAGDPRVTHFVYMAGAPSFTDWYLFTPKKEGAEKDTFVAKLAPLDPIAHLAKISPRPVLLQFGTKDQFITNDAASAIAAAVPGPKTVKTYDFEHELTYQARLDRIAWLKDQFTISK